MRLDLAIVVFDSLYDAEVAYADARDRAPDEPWVREIGFVEHQRGGRITFRGTFAGHFLEIDDIGDAVGPDPAVGALTGALIGAIWGPPGFAAGLAGGAFLGGYHESMRAVPDVPEPLRDEIRRDLPEGTAGVLLLAAPDHVDSMIQAFDGLGGRVVRHSLTEDEVAGFMAAVQGAPPAADRSAG